MNRFFAHRRVVVTGGAGFLGRQVVQRLRDRGCENIFVPRRATCDLRRWDNICRLLDGTRPDLIIHLAGTVTGIGATRDNPAGSFYDNLIMGAQLMEAARCGGIEKLVILGTVRSYPKNVPVPTREEDLWNGYPEEVNAPYGMAKKILIVQSQAYRQQYGFNSICLLAANLYGPGARLDPAGSHVIPALMQRYSTAAQSGDREVVCWGDGRAMGSFLHLEDCAEAILLAAESYNESAPVNIASDEEISIADLAQRIARLAGFQGRTAWDPTQPSGQHRSCWDVSRAEQAFGFRARKDFNTGLRETFDWYRDHFTEREENENNCTRVSEHQ
jgi:GDP-L-fucose synthase